MLQLHQHFSEFPSLIFDLLTLSSRREYLRLFAVHEIVSGHFYFPPLNSDASICLDMAIDASNFVVLLLEISLSNLQNHFVHGITCVSTLTSALTNLNTQILLYGAQSVCAITLPFRASILYIMVIHDDSECSITINDFAALLFWKKELSWVYIVDLFVVPLPLPFYLVVFTCTCQHDKFIRSKKNCKVCMHNTLHIVHCMQKQNGHRGYIITAWILSRTSDILRCAPFMFCISVLNRLPLVS